MRRFKAVQTHKHREAPPPLLEISSWCRFAESREPQSIAGGLEQNPIARRRRADAAYSATPRPSRLGAQASHRAPEPEKAPRAAVAQTPNRVRREPCRCSSTNAQFHASPLRWRGCVALSTTSSASKVATSLGRCCNTLDLPTPGGPPSRINFAKLSTYFCRATRAAVETDEYRIQSN